jgi:hypothetical protein
MVIRVPEIHVDDVAEMLQALLDQLNLHRKGEDPKDITAPSFDRLVAAFEDEVKTSRGDDG